MWLLQLKGKVYCIRFFMGIPRAHVDAGEISEGRILLFWCILYLTQALMGRALQVRLNP
jgi:hypothetical protein